MDSAYIEMGILAYLRQSMNLNHTRGVITHCNAVLSRQAFIKHTMLRDVLCPAAGSSNVTYLSLRIDC